MSNSNICLTLFISMEMLRKSIDDEEITLTDLFVDYYRKMHPTFRISKFNPSIQSGK